MTNTTNKAGAIDSMRVSVGIVWVVWLFAITSRWWLPSLMDGDDASHLATMLQTLVPGIGMSVFMLIFVLVLTHLVGIPSWREVIGGALIAVAAVALMSTITFAAIIL